MAKRLTQTGGDPDKKIQHGTQIQQAEKPVRDPMLDQERLLQRYYVMLGGMYAGLLLMTDEGHVEFLNRAYCDSCGLKELPDELTGITSTVLLEKIKHAFLNPEQAIARISEILQRGEPVRGEEFFMRDGRTMMGDFIPLNVEGKSCGRLWVHVDVTERKRAERELKDSEHRYRQLVQSSPDAIIVHSNSDFLYANAAALKLYGAEALWQLKERNFLGLIHRDDRDAVLERMGQLKKGEKIPLREMRLITLDERQIQVEAYASRVTYGKEKAVQVIIRDITDRKLAEKMLRESEASLKRAQQIAHLGSWELDLAANRLTWSDEVYCIFGLQPQEACATYEAFLDRVHPEDRAAVDAAYSASVRNGLDSYEIEHRVIRKNSGEIRHVQEKCRHVRDANGHVVLSLGMVLDITERKVAQETLAENEQRYRGIVETAEEGIATHEPDGTITYVNQRMAKMLGYSQEEIIGRSSLDFLDDDEREGVIRARESVKEKGSFSRELKLRRKDGSILWTLSNISPRRDGSGNFLGYLAMHTDITERKRTEEALRVSEARFRTLVTGSKPIIFRASCDGYILDAPGWEVATGQSREDYQGEGWLKQVHPEDLEELTAQWSHSLASGEPAHINYRMLTRDSQWRWMHAYAMPVRSADGQITEWVGTVTDIHDRYAAQESLRKSEARFRILAQTAEKLLRSPDPRAVVNELCREVMKVLDCHVFFNYLVDAKTGSLLLNAFGGIPAEEAKKIERIDLGVSACGCVAQSGEPMIAEDIQCSTDVQTDLVRSYGVQAYYCHPLNGHQGLIGTLSFGTRMRPRFTDFEVEVMRTIADQVAVAMQRVHAEESLRELNSTLEIRVEERTAEINALASQLRELASELTLTEQRERQRIAKVLHDHIQQLLVAAKIHTAALVNRQQSETMKTSARLVNDLIDQTISASRDLTTDLIPPVLHDAGLGPALQWLARNFSEKHGLQVEVTFNASGEPKDDDVRVFMFDAAREVLFNIVKHSGVLEAHIECYGGKDQRVHLVVRDQGKGFNTSRLQTGERSQGFGLFSIQQRLKHLGGSFDIQSAPGQGTRVALIGPPPPTVQPSPCPVFPEAFVAAEAHMRASDLKIRVLLADDHHIMRQGLAGILGAEPDIEVVGEAANGAQAVNLAKALHPDVIVMDVSMPVLNGIEATIEICRNLPYTKVIGLSMHEEGELSSAIRQAGAVAYVTKGGAPEALVHAIRKAVSNKVQ